MKEDYFKHLFSTFLSDFCLEEEKNLKGKGKEKKKRKRYQNSKNDEEESLFPSFFSLKTLVRDFRGKLKRWNIHVEIFWGHSILLKFEILFYRENKHMRNRNLEKMRKGFIF